jgi:hypothetical protein
MGKIRVVSARTNSLEDVSHGLRRDPDFGSDRTVPAAGHECPDGEIYPIVEFHQAPDASRSRGYGRYEI